MIRVLHINAGSGIYGGVSAFCLNIYRNINRNEVQFDFLTPNRTTYGQFEEEIRGYGGHIYELGINSSTTAGKIRLRKALKKFLSEHTYDIIHVNAGVLFFNCVVASACRQYSNARIFVHSHNNGGRSRLKERLSYPLKLFLSKQADCQLACSVSAAEYMFPKGTVPSTNVINNGIMADEFRFNPGVRMSVRDEMNLEDRFVVGHVGRFTRQKNHEFLIDLFAGIKEHRSDAALMLVGEGPLMDSVRARVREKGLEGDVLFLGARSDTARLYQAMDVFVLPSVFEGFGIVNIEAQTAGLKCVTSSVVPEAVNITGNVVRIPLDAPGQDWIRQICDTPSARRDYSEVTKEKGFDMVTSAVRLESLYKEAVSHE